MTEANHDKPEATGISGHRGRQAAWYVFAVTAAVVIAVFLWAMFWPASACDRPSCARQRYSVALEIDTLGQIEPISFDVDDGDDRVSLKSIMRGGGIELTPAIDQIGLPYAAESGPLDRADLFQLVTAWRSNSTKGKDATLYALLVYGLIADNGEELFGMMFDTAGREGFAVAPRTTERFYREHAPRHIPTLQLRTFAHELLHALNRDHADAVQTPDGRLTLEAPTRCISQKQQRGWSLIEPPLMELSPHTIRFFQTAAPRDVLPGPENSPFTRRQASPTECDDARAQTARPGENTRWAIAVRRLKTLLFLRSAQAASDSQSRTPFAQIRLQAQSAAYPLGYPIAVRVMVDNSGADALPIVGRLSPRYGMLMIEYRAAGAEDWRVVEPMSLFEPTNNEDALLHPGARAEETVPIYYGQEGWTFEAAGEYEVRARLQLGPSAREVISEPLQISVTAPTTAEDRDALQPLLDADGHLSNDIGRLLYFGGRIGEREDMEPLEEVAEKYGHTALGGAMRLTLLSQRLRRPIDPMTGMRPPPDLEQARELVDDTCTDSGVAAMTSDVLEQRQSALPPSLQARAETNAAAWEGTTSAKAAFATYSDPLLELRGPSLHFCFNEAQLRRPVRDAVSKFARHLRKDRPSRIVLVGHSDAVGTCRFNEELALRRAREVQRALVSAGLRRIPMEVVSIGERRPLSFAAANDAQQLNRRVEILVEGAVEHDANVGNIIPKCPALPAHRPIERSIEATNNQR
jgi:outer membrane protein OmpA-like peptidoglycan-associated protein